MTDKLIMANMLLTLAIIGTLVHSVAPLELALLFDVLLAIIAIRVIRECRNYPRWIRRELPDGTFVYAPLSISEAWLQSSRW